MDKRARLARASVQPTKPTTAMSPAHAVRLDLPRLSSGKRPATPTNDVLFGASEISPEYKLLYKLFVPKKYLIKNNKVSARLLASHLPNLVPLAENSDSITTLNFQVHLFLASIMVNYVNSWYLTKLNTDNMEFVMLAYQLMSDFVRDLCLRVENVVKNEARVMALVDDVAQTINGHLQLVSSSSRPAFVEEYRSAQKNILNHDKTDQELVDEYLTQNHIVFDQSLPESRLNYFRILARKIVTETFISSPLQSKIAMTLIVALLGDLVLDKVFFKLSSPEFVLKTVVGSVVDALEQALNDRISRKPPKVVTAKPWKTRVSSMVALIYSKTTGFLVNSKEEHMLFANVSVFNNSVFALVDTITGFSYRKPILCDIIVACKNYLAGVPRLNQKLNSLCIGYATNQISLLLTEDRISSIIADLRKNLFDKGTTDEAPESFDIDSLTERIHAIITEKLPQVIPFLSYLNYIDNEELKQSITNTLSLFNYQPELAPESPKNQLHQACQLNQLLTINILDTVVATLYPELTV